MSDAYAIRDATPRDLDDLVASTLAEARAAEGLELDPAAVRRGVAAAFGEPPRARYWVAERAGALAGHVSVVTEWSNFRGGDYWWIQSAFVLPAHRGTGLVQRLIDHVAAAARAAGALDLRLYAHAANGRALRAWERCGFARAPYVLMTRRP